MKIAIVGAGIVGSTAATTYQRKDAEVTVFDHGLGQATKAAAGLSAPGFPSVVIKPGIEWPVWEPIFTKI